MVTNWEEAFRQADTPEKRTWLWQQARERDETHEATIGLVRATYSNEELVARVEDAAAALLRAEQPLSDGPVAVELPAAQNGSDGPVGCATCRDTRTVPETPGQPGDGPDPCPDCATSSEFTDDDLEWKEIP